MVVLLAVEMTEGTDVDRSREMPMAQSRHAETGVRSRAFVAPF
jgi:hypothetical protein